MKTSKFALAIAACVALGACSSGDSQLTKTVTKTEEAEADAANSNTRDRVETADDGASEDIPEEYRLPSFKSVEDMAY